MKAILLFSALFSIPALADVEAPQVYLNLQAVELSPSQTPRLEHGFQSLAQSETRHLERLPLQLGGAVERLQKAKYKPTIRR